jgi:hypothetical protein
MSIKECTEELYDEMLCVLPPALCTHPLTAALWIK